MRVVFFLLAALAALAVSGDAKTISDDSVIKKKFLITSPGSSEALEAVYVKNGNDKYLILHLNDEESLKDTELSSQDDMASFEDDSASNIGQEERAIGTVDAASKLKKQLSSPNYNSMWNKLLRVFFRKITPKDYRLPDPPKVPARMRPIRVNS
ncbi:hypothetical protein P3T76_014081 [Phytophthora citrophthora]|uniref:RxLR effector protein n=1 Tax=Phytophthora citrophthora TaxID=4793 RepID=A0AAD9LBI0_9STRA|nr:hypothetical protein P3T76_014079 [Phytophthora citrophthora]KAK1930410.1 hypothetical protein P3T76_014081 [Phytophthora citrophthora]